MKLKRILVVDDDADDQQFFREGMDMLAEKLYCERAHSGTEALDILDKLPPFDLIFLDLNMPLMNGFDLLIILKTDTKYKAIPVVIMSTSDSHADIQKCMQLGAEKYLVKPCELEEMVSNLTEVLTILD
ncbi:MAG: response regulator [Ferruginibacter sp.]